jgi:hypothetical protein
MSEIMEKSSQPDNSAPPPEIGRAEIEPVLESLSRTIAELVEDFRSHMHDAKRVLEPRMHGSGENCIRPSKLSNPTETLKYRVLDNLTFIRFNPDKSVDWARDLKRPVDHEHA